MVAGAKAVGDGRRAGSVALFKGFGCLLEIGPCCDLYTGGHRGGWLGVMQTRCCPSTHSSSAGGCSGPFPAFSSWWREGIEGGSGRISSNKLELSPDLEEVQALFLFFHSHHGGGRGNGKEEGPGVRLGSASSPPALVMKLRRLLHLESSPAPVLVLSPAALLAERRLYLSSRPKSCQKGASAAPSQSPWHRLPAKATEAASKIEPSGSSPASM